MVWLHRAAFVALVVGEPELKLEDLTPEDLDHDTDIMVTKAFQEKAGNMSLDTALHHVSTASEMSVDDLKKHLSQVKTERSLRRADETAELNVWKMIRDLIKKLKQKRRSVVLKLKKVLKIFDKSRNTLKATSRKCQRDERNGLSLAAKFRNDAKNLQKRISRVDKAFRRYTKQCKTFDRQYNAQLKIFKQDRKMLQYVIDKSACSGKLFMQCNQTSSAVYFDQEDMTEAYKEISPSVQNDIQVGLNLIKATDKFENGDPQHETEAEWSRRMESKTDADEIVGPEGQNEFEEDDEIKMLLDEHVDEASAEFEEAESAAEISLALDTDPFDPESADDGLSLIQMAEYEEPEETEVSADEADDSDGDDEEATDIDNISLVQMLQEHMKDLPQIEDADTSEDADVDSMDSVDPFDGIANAETETQEAPEEEIMGTEERDINDDADFETQADSDLEADDEEATEERDSDERDDMDMVTPEKSLVQQMPTVNAATKSTTKTKIARKKKKGKKGKKGKRKFRKPAMSRKEADKAMKALKDMEKKAKSCKSLGKVKCTGDLGFLGHFKRIVKRLKIVILRYTNLIDNHRKGCIRNTRLFNRAQRNNRQQLTKTNTRALLWNTNAGKSRKCWKTARKNYRNAVKTVRKQGSALQNEAGSFAEQACSFIRLRAEVEKLSGSKNKITNCQLSRFRVVRSCTRQCGCGVQIFKRVVERQPSGEGAIPCPPKKYMTAKGRCNCHRCPVNCRMDAWGGWSSCTRRYGGGRQTKRRKVLQHARFGGRPCKSTYKRRKCNTRSAPRFSRGHRNSRLIGQLDATWKVKVAFGGGYNRKNAFITGMQLTPNCRGHRRKHKGKWVAPWTRGGWHCFERASYQFAIGLGARNFLSEWIPVARFTQRKKGKLVGNAIACHKPGFYITGFFFGLRDSFDSLKKIRCTTLKGYSESGPEIRIPINRHGSWQWFSRRGNGLKAMILKKGCRGNGLMCVSALVFKKLPSLPTR